MTPVPKIEDGPDEESPHPETKRLAQALTGELMWISTRTRPDICYAVGLMSRLLHRRPDYVTKLGFHVLRYLHGTSDYGLENQPGEISWRLVGASYAPPHEQHRSVHAVMITHGSNLLLWESARQPYITQSTELLACTEGLQALRRS